MAMPGTPTNIMPMPYSPLLLSQPPFQDEVKPPPTNNIGEILLLAISYIVTNYCKLIILI